MSLYSQLEIKYFSGTLTALYPMHAISFVTYMLGKSYTILNDRFANRSVVYRAVTGTQSDWSTVRDTWSCLRNSFS
jgi:hypothetical protein